MKFLAGYVILFIMFFFGQAITASEDYNILIKNGEFKEAAIVINNKLNSNNDLTDEDKIDLQCELEKMERIRKDFTKSSKEVISYINKYIPDITTADISSLEESMALEYKMIDGEKRYFNDAAPNLFKIDKRAKAIKKNIEKENIEKNGIRKFPLNEHISDIIEAHKNQDSSNVLPVMFKIKQSVSVDENVIPDGEVIRCWIPFPRDIEDRQVDIEIISTNPEVYILSDNSSLQRTIYFEKIAQDNTTTTFTVEYKYTSYGIYIPINPQEVRVLPKNRELLPYLSETPPHIVFTEDLQELSRTIVADEANPYIIARKIFEWVDQNVPWASAREYSTIPSIPVYASENRHCDCGIQTLLFMALCRINGIPARWQSGWEFQPPRDSMHDWCQIYIEPYGWIPVDVTYGLRDSNNNDIRWFYLSGIDSYRLIFNDDHANDFYPAKIYFRSDTVDSQRGEVEWRGGNIYFDKRSWTLDWEIIPIIGEFPSS